MSGIPVKYSNSISIVYTIMILKNAYYENDFKKTYLPGEFEHCPLVVEQSSAKQSWLISLNVSVHWNSLPNPLFNDSVLAEIGSQYLKISNYNNFAIVIFNFLKGKYNLNFNLVTGLYSPPAVNEQPGW